MKIQALKQLWKRSLRPNQGVEAFRPSRSHGLSILFFVVFGIIAVRAMTIQIFSPSADILEKIARNQYQTKIDLAPYRGNIYDRRGEPLAISIRRPSFYVNPRAFDPSPAQTKKLSAALNIPSKKIRSLAKRKNYFAWLARKVERQNADAVNRLEIEGLYEISEPARYYPNGRELTHLLGNVGIDNNGLSGLEYGYDKTLMGEKLSTYRNKDARGKLIYQDSLLALPEKTGRNIVLTIDSAIQDIAQKAMVKGLENAQAKSGFAIVSDPHTGRILAIANATRVHSKDVSIEVQDARNYALSNVYEPGSVVKPLLIAKALEAGVVSLDEVHNTYNGVYREDKWKIHDDHPEPSMTTTEVVTKSSNIGTYNIMKRMGTEAVHQAYMDFGFTSSEQMLDFPGQMRGRIDAAKSWKGNRFATICFGQGMTVAALELVQAFSSIANGGSLMKPYLIDHIESPEGVMIESGSSEVLRRVLKPEFASRARSLLQETVESGTGRFAKLTEYTSAGKTGTSQKVDPQTRRYSDTMRTASFIGFAPATDPHLTIYVVVDEPGKRPGTGGLWAAPIFREIAEASLRYLNVAPDKIVQKEDLAKATNDHLKLSND